MILFESTSWFLDAEQDTAIWNQPCHKHNHSQASTSMALLYIQDTGVQHKEAHFIYQPCKGMLLFGSLGGGIGTIWHKPFTNNIPGMGISVGTVVAVAGPGFALFRRRNITCRCPLADIGPLKTGVLVLCRLVQSELPLF